MLATDSQKTVLQGFIKDFFNIQAALNEIILVTPYSIKSYKEYFLANGDKKTDDFDNLKEISVLRETLRDVTVVINTADLLIELQIYHDKYFIVRSLYYLCDRFCANYNMPGKMELDKEGNPYRYSSLRPVYAMNIVKREYFSQDEDAIHIFKFYDKEHELTLNKEYLMLGYFELLKKKVQNTNQGYWRTLFLTGTVAADAPDYINLAKNLIDFVNLDEDERKMVSAIERAEANYHSIIGTAYDEGHDDGEVKKGIRAAVNNVIMFHCSISVAMEAAELDSKYRDEVISELKKRNIFFTEE